MNNTIAKTKRIKDNAPSKPTPAKLPFGERIYLRAMHRWGTGNISESVRYFLAASSSMPPHLREVIISRLPLPFAQAVRLADDEADRIKRARKAAEEAEQEVRKQAAREQAIVEAERIEALRQKKLSLKSEHERTVFLAGLTPSDRDTIATSTERREAIIMRKSTILAGEVKTILGCTQRELDRWNADGRLPHLFMRRIQLARTTNCRFWSVEQVYAATELVPAWREQDADKKRYGRRGLHTVLATPVQ